MMHWKDSQNPDKPLSSWLTFIRARGQVKTSQGKVRMRQVQEIPGTSPS